MNERVFKETDRLRLPERIERLELNKVIEKCINETNLQSILDIGTGSGLFAEAFFDKGIAVAGIDINPEMIEHAKKYLPNSDFRVAVAEDLPFDDSEFDGCFFGVVLHEVDDYKKSLEEAFRVCRIATLILEWKYENQEFGPPLEHRLKPEFIEEISQNNGFKRMNTHDLTNLVLYVLFKI